MLPVFGSSSVRIWCEGCGQDAWDLRLRLLSFLPNTAQRAGQ